MTDPERLAADLADHRRLDHKGRNGYRCRTCRRLVRALVRARAREAG